MLRLQMTLAALIILILPQTNQAVASTDVALRDAREATLPHEPDYDARVEEIYDQEARMFIILYSLGDNGQIDYITGRLVLEQSHNLYGNPVYATNEHPLFYWWNHVMWNDPEMDGVNGNERVYQRHIDFDLTRYAPCRFNGHNC
ncbi:hypothetical protein YTPLAS18_15950 [Nitrospira sp.]|nr:hypothetical protein YTPLAS18_15950 [Nitrospira sp.]